MKLLNLILTAPYRLTAFFICLLILPFKFKAAKAHYFLYGYSGYLDYIQKNIVNNVIMNKFSQVLYSLACYLIILRQIYTHGK